MAKIVFILSIANRRSHNNSIPITAWWAVQQPKLALAAVWVVGWYGGHSRWRSAIF